MGRTIFHDGVLREEKNPARRLRLTKAWLPWLRLAKCIGGRRFAVLTRGMICAITTEELLLVYLRCKDICTGDATRGDELRVIPPRRTPVLDLELSFCVLLGRDGDKH
jgi:hypothetical protein